MIDVSNGGTTLINNRKSTVFGVLGIHGVVGDLEEQYLYVRAPEEDKH